MSRKHNCSKKGRSPSRYKERLAARGLTKAPTLPTLEELRKRQQRSDWRPGRQWT